jgi:hypothetical protein
VVDLAMSISYEPNGTSGYTCRLVGSNGLSVKVALSSGDTHVDVTPTSLPTLALVGAVAQFGNHEFGRRRTRDTRKRRHHEKQAAAWRKTAEHISELIGDLTETAEDGWCSCCFAHSTHRLVSARTRFGSRQYVCVECGSPTRWCDVLRCDHFANRCDMPRKAKKFCAEHSHDIPSFETLSKHVGSLDEYMEWLDFDRINASRVTTVAAASLAGLIVVGPLAVAAAPAIGGAIGAASGLSGAAATNFGLAFLGGGSLAAGGFGMAGGTLVVAAGGMGLGGAVGANVATAYVGSDKSFGFEKLADGGGATVIFANGFLSEGKTGWGDWKGIVRERYPDATVYRLTWGAKELKSFAPLVNQRVAKLAEKAVRDLVAQATKGGSKLLGPLNTVFIGAGLAKNPWHVARTRATMTGSVVADAIVRSDMRSAVLIGFSLGARVMVAAAESLATRHGEGPRIASMHLLGGAVGVGRDWHTIEKAVEGNVWNYWSKNDKVLRYLYRAGEAGQRAIGSEGIPARSRWIKNVNVSRMVYAHQDHLKCVKLR